jgi:hypothetical protein
LSQNKGKNKRINYPKNGQMLQKLSQHSIKNCMYDLQFGCHNKQGIHGACPVEMLHALLLGLFWYTCDCFSSKLETHHKQQRLLTGIPGNMGN